MSVYKHMHKHTQTHAHTRTRAHRMHGDTFNEFKRKSFFYMILWNLHVRWMAKSCSVNNTVET